MFLGDVRRELFADSRDGVKKDVVERLTLWLGPVAFFALAAGGLYVSAKELAGASMGSYIEGVGAGTGLLAIGHSVHRASRRPGPADPPPQSAKPADDH
jgi:hypothetical protein